MSFRSPALKFAHVDDFQIVDYTSDDPDVQKIYAYGENYIFNMQVKGYKDAVVAALVAEDFRLATGSTVADT